MLRKNSLTNYNPFNEMAEMEKRFFGEPFDFFKTGGLDEFKTDIKDEGDKFVLIADMPGFSKDDIKLDVDSDVLTVSAERHSEHEDKDKKGKYIRQERYAGACSRSFYVGEGIRPENVSAKFENGILQISLPKADQKKLPETTSIAIE